MSLFQKLFLLLITVLLSQSLNAGQIEVVKQIIGGNNSTFNIVIDGNSAIPISDGVSTGFVTVTNGSTVSISENSSGLPKFTNISYQCIDGLGNLVATGDAVRNSSSLATFSVTVPNSTTSLENQLTCTLFNIKKASLLLSKTTTNGDNTTAFSYTVNANGAVSTASLTGGGSTEVILGKKFSGTVIITETVPLGWTLQSSSCVNLDGNPVTTSGTNPITVTLAQGDNVLCSFINAPAPGVIIIDKQTNPSLDPTSFIFTPDYGASFTLSDADVPNNSGLIPPGVYSVSEALPVGWTLNNASCNDGSPVTAIDLASNETVTCTFVNDRNPTLTLLKTVVNDNGGTAVETDFIPSIDGAATTWGTIVPLATGAHSSSETNLSGYIASVWSGDCAADGSIALVVGQVASCSITNDDIQRVADLSVTKTDAQTTYTPGDSFSYTITVDNNGPDAGDGAVLTDALAAWAIGTTWTCTASGGAVCPNASGSGSLNETIATLPNGGQLVYILVGTYSTDMNDY